MSSIARDVMQGLHREHACLSQLFAVLEMQMDVFHKGGTPDYDLVVEVSEFLVDFPARCHHPKEDAVYALLMEHVPSLAGELTNLLIEHDQLAILTEQFSKNIASVLSEAEIPREAIMEQMARYIDAQRAHMKMEEAVFFPAVEKHLKPEQWAVLATRASQSDDPVFGHDAGEKFISQCENIMRSVGLDYEAEHN